MVSAAMAAVVCCWLGGVAAVKTPACSCCGRPAGESIEIAGQHVCPDCFKNLPKCTICSTPILGRGYALELGTICETCLEHLPKCRRCVLPLSGEFKLLREAKFCPSCYRNLPVCISCEERINNTYVVFPGQEGNYCSSCYHSMLRCMICGMPADSDHTSYDDGRIVCSGCRREAIFEPDTARQYLEVVTTFLSKRLNMKIPRVNNLSLVGSDKLGLLKKDGTIEETACVFNRDRGLMRVFAAYGLPPSFLIAALTREYTRTWQHANCPAEQSQLIAEGFVDWVEEMVLKQSGRTCIKPLRRMQENGRESGLRLMKRIERKRGIDGLLRYVKTTVEPGNLKN